MTLKGLNFRESKEYHGIWDIKISRKYYLKCNTEVNTTLDVILQF